MYATLTVATIDQEQQEQLQKNLDGQIVQNLQQQDGFLGAYFTEPQDGIAWAVSLWESQSHAEQAGQDFQTGSSPMSGALISVVASRPITNIAVSEQGAQYFQQASQQTDSQQAAQQLGS